MTYYLIRIQDIPETGSSLDASTESDAWFEKIIRDSISGEIHSFNATLHAKIVKIERSIELTGGIYLKLNTSCDRCMDDFVFEQQIPFRMVLEPARQDRGKGAEYEEGVGDISEALDFSYYSGDEVDIGDLMRQHIVMAQPIRHVCSEECKGLCPQCGKNLNEGPCGCPKAHSDSPFTVLKELKR